MYVSTRRNYIKAMRGNLKITAEFLECTEEIEEFDTAPREPAAYPSIAAIIAVIDCDGFHCVHAQPAN